MEWLNYHHLLYFWLVAKAGSVSAAARELHLTRPTVTFQVRELEKAVGQKLFAQKGRQLVLTEFGQEIFRYADQIFAIGQELREFIATGEQSSRDRLRIGMPDVVPKWIAFELLRPVLEMEPKPRLECYEGRLESLLADLALHKLDLVFSDSPAPSSFGLDVFTHALGHCGLSFLSTSALAGRYRGEFPQSLGGAPLLLPTERTAIRRALDRWLEQHAIFPNLVAECEDSAMLKVFGQAGEGIFPVPTVIEQVIMEQFGVELVGRIQEIQDRFYAISVEKRVQHEATRCIVQAARRRLFIAN